jgi:hypothetical protein
LTRNLISSAAATEPIRKAQSPYGLEHEVAYDLEGLGTAAKSTHLMPLGKRVPGAENQHPHLTQPSIKKKRSPRLRLDDRFSIK